MGRPSLLILDEPTAGLDVVEYERLKSLLFCGDPLAEYMLVSTYDVHELTDSFDNVILLDSGHLRFAGTVAEFWL